MTSRGALTGRPPFHAASPIDTLLQVLHDEPLSPRRLDSSIPRDLETICLKCLEKDPRHRYPSATEVSQELSRWLGGEPIQARPAGALERGLKWVRRKKALAAAIAIGVVAVMGFGVASWLHNAILERELETSRRHLYAATISVAQDLIDDGDFARAANELTAIDPADGLEPVATLLEPDSEIMCVAMSRDGESIAVGSAAGEIVLWDPKTGRPRCRWSVRNGGVVSALAFSDDGTLLVSAAGGARFWRAK